MELDDELCVSCEACLAVCPVGAVTMVYSDGQFLPRIDGSLCTNCGKCESVCPGSDIETETEDRYKAVYSAYVPNRNIRKNSTSGGVISKLLASMIEEDMIDGAFVLNYDAFRGDPARLTLVNDTRSIYLSAGSKYIPASVFNVLKRVKDGGKYAVVGTPCLIKAIKNFLKIEKIDAEIVYFGLFCDRTMNFNFQKYMEETYAKKGEKLIHIDYRNKEKRGWPGDVKLKFDSGREMIIDRRKRMDIKDYFMLERCLYCVDKLNSQAEISFGDCYFHGEEYPEKTSVILRTDKGRDIFNRFSHLMTVKESDMDGVRSVQGMEERKINRTYAESFTSGKKSKTLRKRRKKIDLGRNYSRYKINFALQASKIKRVLSFTRRLARIYRVLLKGQKKKATTGNKNILITGGGLSNKGAQAMTFTVVSNIRRSFPSKNIYLLEPVDFRRDPAAKKKYPFKIIPWDQEEKIKILQGKGSRFQGIIENTYMILDVSGYGITSQVEPPYMNVYKHLLDMAIAKTYSIPMYLLPQSIGPFDYRFPEKPFLWMMQKKYFKYPEHIYCRERAGTYELKKFTSDNVEVRHDIVLTEDYEIPLVYSGTIKEIKIETNTVGIVPNKRVFSRVDPQELLAFYKEMIHDLRKKKYTVLLLLHSNEDRSLIKDLKSLFPNDDRVVPITEELNSFELENIISNLKVMVASRYHSIIHAYRNGVPCLVLGWAVKYQELLDDFSQSDYIFDVRQGLDRSQIMKKVNKLVVKRDEESDSIMDSLAKIRREEGSIFEEIFEICDHHELKDNNIK